jgi:hypothetical protein
VTLMYIVGSKKWASFSQKHMYFDFGKNGLVYKTSQNDI